MKKLVLLGAVAIVALSSCKKEYECCTTTTTVGVSGEACVTAKYTKSEVDDIEAASVSTGVSTIETKCTKK